MGDLLVSYFDWKVDLRCGDGDFYCKLLPSLYRSLEYYAELVT